MSNDASSAGRGNLSYLLWILLTAILPVLISSGLGLLFYHHIGDLSGWPDMLLFFFVVSLTMACALTPTTFVALVSGYFFGWKGLLGILLSYPIAALIGRQVGHLLLKRYSRARWFQQAKYHTLIEALHHRPFRMLVFARLSPVLPFAMSNLLLAQVPIPLPTYLAGTMVGMLPRSLFALFIGSQASEFLSLLKSSSTENSVYLSIILFLISSIGLGLIVRRVWRKVISSSPPLY